MLLDLGTGGWALALIAASAIGLAKGGLAMAGIISVPLLSLVLSPVQAAGVLLPVYVISDVGGLLAFRRNFDTEVLRKSLPGAVGGIALGWATASIVPVWGVTLIVGLIGFAFALNALLRPKIGGLPQRPRWSQGSLWGGLAGYTSFVSHSGAPLWQVYAQPLRMTPLIFAGTTTWFFAIGNWIKLLPYALLGQLSVPNLVTSAVLMPVSLVAVWVGLRLVRIIPQVLFYKLLTWGLLIVSLRLIWQGLA